MIKKFIVRGLVDYQVMGSDMFFWVDTDQGNVGDEYHTIHELYEHRLALTVALFKIYDNYITPLVKISIKCWKSKLHSDGTMFEGDYFIVGMTFWPITGPEKHISYHYQMKHWNKFNVMELECAPKYDGHTSRDVIKRLLEL